jgi:hypothetical protein
MEIKLRDEKIGSNSKKYVVLDQNFDLLLHRTDVVKNGLLEATSDSYLIFSQDPNTKQEYENFLFCFTIGHFNLFEQLANQLILFKNLNLISNNFFTFLMKFIILIKLKMVIV